jgi:hypothetical protein
VGSMWATPVPHKSTCRRELLVGGMVEGTVVGIAGLQ